MSEKETIRLLKEELDQLRELHAKCHKTRSLSEIEVENLLLRKEIEQLKNPPYTHVKDWPT